MVECPGHLDPVNALPAFQEHGTGIIHQHIEARTSLPDPPRQPSDFGL